MTIYRSPYPDLPIPAVSLTQLVLGRARERARHTALVDAPTGRRLSYGKLAAAVDATAAGLQAWGLRRGEVAALCTPNCIEFPIAFHAAARLGAAVTTMNPTFTSREMARQLEDSGAVVAFTTAQLAGQVRQAGGRTLRGLFCFDDGSFEQLAGKCGAPAAVEIDPERDVVALPYSSGTTGVPKGVMLTHRNLVAMLELMGPVEGTHQGDTVAAALPFFHIYGLLVILNLGLYRGATLVVFPHFDLEQLMGAIERYRITRLPLVPPLVLRLARDPRVERFDHSSVRTVISGAAPLPPDLAAEMAARFHCLVKQGYGLTELSPGSHMHPEDGGQPPPGSVGVLHPNTTCRLVDPATQTDVAPGQSGEIWVKGPQVMKGYLNQPEATREMITPDGWLRTGDVGTIDGRGYLYVVDRLKELIKYKGFQVAPAELEALLLTHPGVADAAVIPRADAEAGEVPKAVVVPRPESGPTADELLDFVAGQVVPYKRIREVEFVDEIPRSPSGKILRRLLVERERSS